MVRSLTSPTLWGHILSPRLRSSCQCLYLPFCYAAIPHPACRRILPLFKCYATVAYTTCYLRAYAFLSCGTMTLSIPQSLSFSPSYALRARANATMARYAAQPTFLTIKRSWFVVRRHSMARAWSILQAPFSWVDH